MKRLLPVLFLALLTFAFIRPNPKKGDYPAHYFSAPVSHKILLSGTFGELRPNHFHAGIDIKSSRGIGGDPIFAAADGYVSKIRVEESGYGKSLYVNHPNGYTTVYAHLEGFSSELDEYVKRMQYEQKKFVLEIEPGELDFPVMKGQQIARMGNTGASYGAHLHFEVRETKTQDPINPLLFGIHVTDNIAPKMHNLKVYSLNDKKEEYGSKTYNLLKSGNNYSLKGDTILFSGEQAGLGLKVYDHFDKVSNWNGIYSLEMYQNDTLAYQFNMESFGFDETRYINAHCDYVERVTNNSYFNRCYELPGNRLSIYNPKNNGIIDFKTNGKSKIKLVASDVAGNVSTLEFWIKSTTTSLPPSISKDSYHYILPYNEGNIIQTEELYLHMPKGTLYENLYLKYDVTPDKSNGQFSSVHHIHNSRTPVHDYFDVGLRPVKSIPAELKSKVFVALCRGGSVTNCGGEWKDGFLRAKVRSLGDYCIMSDEVPPSIRPVSFNANMKGYSKISFKISDNVATDRRIEGLDYQATVDGVWVLMEYDKKSATLTYYFDEKVAAGEHEFRLVVKDGVGNETVFEKRFVR